MLNDWMSNWYGEDWWTYDHLPTKLKKGINEVIIDAQNQKLLQQVQERGFELVETVIEFKTLVESIDKVKNTKLRCASTKDLPKILDITKECFYSNKKFHNRFKNRKFFTEKQCQDYYLKSISNYFEQSITSVVEEENEVVGYYMLKNQSNNIYKGIMTAVNPNYRGKNYHIDMQNFLFNTLKLPFFTINTTQMSNVPVINNHIKEGRKLTKTKYIFYKKHTQ